MSIQATQWAFGLQDERLTPVTKLVLLAIADAAHEDKKFECAVKHTTIARKAHVSVDTAQRRVKDLCALGYLYVIKRRGADGCQVANSYCVLVDEEARKHALAQGWDGNVAPRAHSESGDEDRSLERTESEDRDVTGPQLAARSGPQDERNRAAGYTEPGRTAAAHNRQFLTESNNPPTPPRGEGEGFEASLSETTNGDAEASRRRRGSVEADEDGARLRHWEAFRHAWPWDSTEMPEKARREFMALTSDEQAAAVAAAPRYIEACVSRDRKIAHAKTWLAGKGWQAFDAPKAASKADAHREQIAAAKASLHEQQRRKYGGILVRKGTPQAAAWARHDGQALAFERIGFWEGAVVKPSEWPPSATHGDAPQSEPRREAG
jgi:hypothetical protein